MAELIAEMQIKFGRTVKRECLSPQMSRLVDSGDVTHVFKRWVLTPRHVLQSTHSTPEDAASGTGRGEK